MKVGVLLSVPGGKPNYSPPPCVGRTDWWSQIID